LDSQRSEPGDKEHQCQVKIAKSRHGELQVEVEVGDPKQHLRKQINPVLGKAIEAVVVHHEEAEEDIRAKAGSQNPRVQLLRSKNGANNETLVIDEEVAVEEEVIVDLDLVTSTRTIMIDLKIHMVVMIRGINTMINTNAQLKIRDTTRVTTRVIEAITKIVTLITVIDFRPYPKTNST